MSTEKKLDPNLLRGLDKFKVKEDNVCPLKAEDIEDPDNEFWILQCPKNVDIVNLLKDKKFSLTGKTRLKLKNKTTSSLKKHIKSKKYELVGTSKQVDDSDINENDSSNINSQGENLIVLLPDTEEQLKLVLAPLNGHITVREFIDETPIPTLMAEPKTIHQLPPGVRERHPATWKIVEEYLEIKKMNSKNNTINSPSKKTKGKSRKRRHSFIDVEEEQAPELIQIQEEDGNEDEEDITVVIENVTLVDEEEEDEPPKKKKKKKSRKELDI